MVDSCCVGRQCDCIFVSGRVKTRNWHSPNRCNYWNHDPSAAEPYYAPKSIKQRSEEQGSQSDKWNHIQSEKGRPTCTGDPDMRFRSHSGFNNLQSISLRAWTTEKETRFRLIRRQGVRQILSNLICLRISSNPILGVLNWSDPTFHKCCLPYKTDGKGQKECQESSRSVWKRSKELDMHFGFLRLDILSTLPLRLFRRSKNVKGRKLWTLHTRWLRHILPTVQINFLLLVGDLVVWLCADLRHHLVPSQGFQSQSPQRELYENH